MILLLKTLLIDATRRKCQFSGVRIDGWILKIFEFFVYSQENRYCVEEIISAMIKDSFARYTCFQDKLTILSVEFFSVFSLF